MTYPFSQYGVAQTVYRCCRQVRLRGKVFRVFDRPLLGTGCLRSGSCWELLYWNPSLDWRPPCTCHVGALEALHHDRTRKDTVLNSGQADPTSLFPVRVLHMMHSLMNTSSLRSCCLALPYRPSSYETQDDAETGDEGCHIARLNPMTGCASYVRGRADPIQPLRLVPEAAYIKGRGVYPQEKIPIDHQHSPKSSSS